MRKLLLLGLIVLTVGCQKKPDDPAPASATPPTTTNPPTPQPPVTNCQGATVLYSHVFVIPDVPATTDHVITGFDLTCGDTVHVYFRNQGVPPGTPWTEIHDVPNGASYFSVSNQTVTVHNSTGITLDLDLEATLL